VGVAVSTGVGVCEGVGDETGVEVGAGVTLAVNGTAMTLPLARTGPSSTPARNGSSIKIVRRSKVMGWLASASLRVSRHPARRASIRPYRALASSFASGEPLLIDQ